MGPRHSLGFAVAVVAHELAHIFRNHAVTGISQEQYEAQEAEAWQTVKEWGFEKEKRAYDRFCEKFKAQRQKPFIACESGLIRGGAPNG
jgi:hypothetical protein